MLLDHGADVNASGGECGSALQAAAYFPIVRLLLSKGADVNASGGNYGSALEISSFSGCEAVVQLLQTAIKSQLVTSYMLPATTTRSFFQDD